ncbi:MULTISPECIES: Crp/Fnr family transcriptional regulator [Hydrocarboniphaga]|uniref:Crp/Fnr family transcriptional regulator n=1 Tax=Hydrocarboniphaga TaxID=243627 RepID=UPI00178C803E|nr:MULTISPECIES: helix-turn-helix domain-containing protein [Hydrocarboniphaga]MDZ4079036.1 helix-turn-helix domain-containing protein [Hydrocarboniphaga sp.]
MNSSGPTAATSPCRDCARGAHCLGAALVEGCANPPTVTRTVIDKGEHLFRSGDAGDSLYVVRSGAIKTYVDSAEGEEQIRSFALANDVAGLDAVCGGVHRTGAKAISRTWICRLPLNAVRTRMAESVRFRDRLLIALDREFSRLHRLLDRERYTADRRVASFLLSRIEADATHSAAIELPMSRTDLARHLDLATETVSRVFTRLQGREILRSRGTRCEILNTEALRTVA